MRINTKTIFLRASYPLLILILNFVQLRIAVIFMMRIGLSADILSAILSISLIILAFTLTFLVVFIPTMRPRNILRAAKVTLIASIVILFINLLSDSRPLIILNPMLSFAVASIIILIIGESISVEEKGKKSVLVKHRGFVYISKALVLFGAGLGLFYVLTVMSYEIVLSFLFLFYSAFMIASIVYDPEFYSNLISFYTRLTLSIILFPFFASFIISLAFSVIPYSYDLFLGFSFPTGILYILGFEFMILLASIILLSRGLQRTDLPEAIVALPAEVKETAPVGIEESKVEGIREPLQIIESQKLLRISLDDIPRNFNKPMKISGDESGFNLLDENTKAILELTLSTNRFDDAYKFLVKVDRGLLDSPRIINYIPDRYRNSFIKWFSRELLARDRPDIILNIIVAIERYDFLIPLINAYVLKCEANGDLDRILKVKSWLGELFEIYQVPQEVKSESIAYLDKATERGGNVAAIR